MSKTGNQLMFQQYSALALCSHTVVKLLCPEMTDVFIAPKLWLPNIPDFNAVDYTIWAVLYDSGPVNSLAVPDIDELNQLTDTWSSIQETVIICPMH